MKPEFKLVISLTSPVITDEIIEEARSLLDQRLLWSEVFTTVLENKMAPLFWFNLNHYQLLPKALDSAGLHKLYCLYFCQIFEQNKNRNEVFLSEYEKVAEIFSANGLIFAGLKGAVLIDDIYRADCRMLHDIDVLLDKNQLHQAANLLQEAGYQYGKQDLFNSALTPMQELDIRKWKFLNHNIPHLYKPTGDLFTPYFKISLGGDLFDPGDSISIDAASLLDSLFLVPENGRTSLSPFHTFLSIAAHNYREGRSLDCHNTNDGISLVKLVDLAKYAETYSAEIIDFIQSEKYLSEFSQIISYAIEVALHIYRSEALHDIREKLPNHKRLDIQEIVDGALSYTTKRTVPERIFGKFAELEFGESKFNKNIRYSDW